MGRYHVVIEKGTISRWLWWWHVVEINKHGEAWTEKAARAHATRAIKEYENKPPKPTRLYEVWDSSKL